MMPVDACKEADVAIPLEVLDFFNGEPPDPRGVRVELEEYPHTKNKHGAVKEYHADMQDGYEVDVTKLPEGVTIIRFYNSY